MDAVQRLNGGGSTALRVLSSLEAGMANVGLKIQSGPLERVCSLEANNAEHRAVLSFLGMPRRYRMYRAGTPVAFVGSDASKRTTQFGATEVNLRKDH